MNGVREFLAEYEALVKKYGLFINGETYGASVWSMNGFDDTLDARYARKSYKEFQAALWEGVEERE